MLDCTGWPLLEADKTCRTKDKLQLELDEEVSLCACQSAAEKSDKCGETVFFNTKHCYCVLDGLECNAGTTKNAYSIYQKAGQ